MKEIFFCDAELVLISRKAYERIIEPKKAYIVERSEEFEEKELFEKFEKIKKLLKWIE